MRAKRRIFAGSVCEQEVYTVPERVKDAGRYEPRPRFSSKEEYEEFKRQIARRNFAEGKCDVFPAVAIYHADA